MARDVGEPEGINIPLAALFQKKYGMQAGNIIGTGTYKPDYMPSDPVTGYSPNVTPFWMASAAGAEVEVDTETGRVSILEVRQRRRLRQADQSEDRRDADLRRIDHAASASRCSRRCTSTPAR